MTTQASLQRMTALTEGHLSMNSAAAPRKQDRLTPAEFTLLGMISLAPEDGHIHGYDLNRQMTEGAIGAIIRLESGMLYHYLKKLTRGGLITSTTEHQEGRPTRHLHALTAAGRETFSVWLDTPVQATREMRLEFLLKLWFARHMGRERAATLTRGQRAVIQALIDSLEQQLREAPDVTNDDRFMRAVVELRLAQNCAVASWLDSLEEAS